MTGNNRDKFISNIIAKLQTAETTAGFARNIHEKYLQDFSKLGLPHQKMEEWRFTPLHFLYDNDFDFERNNDLSQDSFNALNIPDVGSTRIVFVNGIFNKELSICNPKDTTVKILTLKQAAEENSELFSKYFATLTDKSDGLQCLNNACFADGAFIYITKNAIQDKAIHLISINNTKDKNVMSMPHNVVVAEDGSQAKVFESIHNVGNNKSFINTFTEIFGLDNSSIDYYKFQNSDENNYYIGTSLVKLDSNAHFHSSTITLKGKFVRNNLNVMLNGEGAETLLHGFYFTTRNDLTDNHTFVDHIVPNCSSNEIYKGIMDDKAKAVFGGKIVVRPDAQKTSAYQTNRNILLSDEAEINTKPQLEIYADDVKCSHGATSGKIDNEEMFYLKSRGISEEKAKALLLNAFASEIVEQIKIPELRNEIKAQIAQDLNIDDVYFCKDIV